MVWHVLTVHRSSLYLFVVFISQKYVNDIAVKVKRAKYMTVLFSPLNHYNSQIRAMYRYKELITERKKIENQIGKV